MIVFELFFVLIQDDYILVSMTSNIQLFKLMVNNKQLYKI